MDFGYAKDFDNRYTIGKLLGHGQFGYTYVATDKKTGDRVAVKKIDKAKVTLLLVKKLDFLAFLELNARVLIWWADDTADSCGRC